MTTAANRQQRYGGIAALWPLTPLQEGLLFHALSDEHDAYAAQIQLDLTGPLDVERLRQAGQALLARHDNLRAAFVHRDLAAPVQLVPRRVELPLQVRQAPPREWDAIAELERRRPFQVTEPPLLRLTVLSEGADRHRVVLTHHHLILDGWSTPLVLMDLFALYSSWGQDGDRPPAPSYQHYLAWLRRQDRDAARHAWEAALRDLDRPTMLAAGRRAGRGAALPDTVQVQLPAHVTGQLQARLREVGVTLSSAVSAAWGVVLGRLTGSADVVFGAAHAGRPTDVPGAESAVGLYITTAPVRVRMRAEETVAELLTRLQREAGALLPHQHLGLAEIQKGTGPLFDTLTVVENYPVDLDAVTRLGPDGLRLDALRHLDATHYPITVSVVPGEQLTVRLAHSAAFGHREAADILHRLHNVLLQIAADPSAPVGALEVLLPGEAEEILDPGSEAEAPRQLVLDAGLRLVPRGVVGDVYVVVPDGTDAGESDPGAVQGLVACPFGGGRMYRSGDRARWGVGGVLEFVGRRDAADDGDFQVKVRGFRVELGEVEAVLVGLVGVASAVVVVREGRLVGFVVPVVGVVLDPVVVRAGCVGVLPDYMVPSVVVVLESLPLTVNGKVDRGALPVVGAGVAGVAGVGGVGGGWRSPGEEVVAGLVADVLGLGVLPGGGESFFELGGDSLSATRLVSRLRSVLGVEVPVRVVFEDPLVGGLAGRVMGLLGGVAGGGVEGGVEGGVRPVLVAGVRPERVGLSAAQARLWFLQRLDPLGATYSVPVGLGLWGGVDVGALEGALGDVVARHEILRTVFVDDPDGLHQIVLPAESARPPLPEEAATAAELPGVLRKRGSVPFDLARDLPLRARLIRVTDPGGEDSETPDAVLLLVVHHIAADGWSLAPLARDVLEAYRARCEGRQPGWAPLPVQYADYALWHERLLGDEADPGSRVSGQIGYWTRVLAGSPDLLELPADFPRPPVASHRGARVPIALDESLRAGIAALARSRQATPFMVLHAALAALLTRLGAGTDIPVGTPVAGRTDAALDELVGMFVNTLVLRLDTGGDPSFTELLGRAREVHLGAHAHQDLPFERLVEILNPPRSLARSPLFQVMLAYGNHAALPDLDLPGARVRPLELSLDVAKVDLHLILEDTAGAAGRGDGQIRGVLEYATDLFSAAGAEAIVERYVRLLRAAVADPDLPLSRLDLLTDGERHDLLNGWSVGPPAPAAASLLDGLEQQAARTPEAIAVEAPDGSLSYAELHARADRLARVLTARGAAPERYVGIALPRSLDLLVALLAVLKTGAAFLPLDPEFPRDRLAGMIEDARPVVVLTGAASRAALPPSTLILDVTAVARGDDGPPPGRGHDPRRPLYVLFTSGSTGRPKGVVVPEHAVSTFLAAMRRVVPLAGADRWLAVTTVGFDISVLELLQPLLSGATIVLAGRDDVRDPARLAALMRHRDGHPGHPDALAGARRRRWPAGGPPGAGRRRGAARCAGRRAAGSGYGGGQPLRPDRDHDLVRRRDGRRRRPPADRPAARR